MLQQQTFRYHHIYHIFRICYTVFNKQHLNSILIHNMVMVNQVGWVYFLCQIVYNSFPNELYYWLISFPNIYLLLVPIIGFVSFPKVGSTTTSINTKTITNKPLFTVLQLFLQFCEVILIISLFTIYFYLIVNCFF